MPPRKSKDKELQPAQAEHADDSPVYLEGENDPIVPPFLSPFVERSYGNLVFKEKEVDHGAFKEQNQAMRRLVESQAESSRRQEEIIRQCIEDMRRVFQKGTRVMRETGEESRRTLQAVSEQVVDQVRQPRPEIPHLVVEMPRQIQEAPILALGGQGNQPYPNIQQQHFVIGEGQRQHQLMEAATPVANHGHQPQHKDHGPTLRPLEKIDKDILRFPDKAKETIGVDADPFLAVSVGVTVADLRSVAKNRSLPYAQRNLAAEDLRWVLAAQTSRHSKSIRPRQPTKRNMVWVRKEKNETITQTLLKGDDQSPTSPKVVSVIVSPDEVLKATFEAQEQSGNRGAKSKEDGTIHFGEFSVNLSCLVLTLPLVFQAKKEEEPIVCEFPEQTDEEVIVVLAQDDEEEDMVDKIVFEKPKEKMARHIRPLYINAHMDGTPISRVLVDNGVAVNVLPTCLLYKIGKSLDDLVHTEVTISDFIRGVNRSRGVLPVELTVGNRTLMSAFFVVDTIATYNALLRHDWIHSSWCIPSSLHQKLIFWNCGKAEVVSANDKPFSANTHLVEARYYEEDISTIQFFGMDRHGKPIGITTCSRSSLSKRVVEEQARLRQEREKAMLEITKKLAAYFVEKAVQVDRSEIVHEGDEADQGDEITLEELDLAPAKLDDLKAEPPRRMPAEVTLKVKEEIEQLVKAGFIWTCRYAKWLSNVVPVLKKNGKLKVCVDFRNLNLATPKDEYPMPIADLLVDGVARHKILSFMDGHNGYNQIFIADADVQKTAFRCPGAVGTFEWVVMPFGLKNAGATYQRAMNAIFHDMIGKFMEIYIDDVVVKSHGEANHLVHLRKAFERMRQHGLKMNPLKCAFGVSASNFLRYLVHERGLQVDKNKARAVIEAKPPQNKKELVFSPLLKLKFEANFKWEEHHQSAFDMIKRTKTMSGAGVVVISPYGLKTQMSFQLDFDCTNNQAENKALIIGLEMLVELKVSMVEVIGDSQLVLKQLFGEYKCTSLALAPYFALAVQLLEEFDDVSIKHVPRDQNYEANEMAQIASSLRIPEGVMQKVVIIEKRSLPSIHQHGMTISTCSIDVTQTNWRFPMIQYLRDQSTKVSRKTKMQALNYVLIEDVLYKRGHDELLLHCLGPDESFQMLSDVHDGICGAHQARIKMRWLIRRHGLFWPSVLKDCIAYAKGCKSCQIHGPLQRVPASELNSIVKPWPFRGWAIDLIVLPMELIARSLRITIQHNLQSGEYDEAMMLELEDLEDTRLTALDRLQAQKLKIAKSYNKRVKGKNLAVGDLVWKAILPLGKKDHKFGKRSPNWEGPFQIHEVLRGVAYWLESLDRELHPRKINGIYLKPYYPTVWEARG
ncbi:hypothetical protein SLEP1_g22629 [Rubroshorea leprosula]|uniref:RNase H type-1 domain-containing protein n=1 Tax=Rubroshorea leprosula TaxID=152421 RepID=A0AAV5JK80_9ROSI|nr:hypothetical protein SLEP1_g22629 [Rubroshorea leprosula]